MNEFEEAARSYRDFADAASAMKRPMLLASQSFIQRGGGRKFRCAKCKKTYVPKYKAIAQRRTGGPGVVPWCLGCVCDLVATWEHPWKA